MTMLTPEQRAEIAEQNRCRFHDACCEDCAALLRHAEAADRRIAELADCLQEVCDFSAAPPHHRDEPLYHKAVERARELLKEPSCPPKS